MLSTMQDVPLTIGAILAHGAGVYGTSLIVTATEDGTRTRTFAEVGERAAAPGRRR